MVKFRDWNNQLNYNHNYPSEVGFLKSLTDIIDIARDSEISHRQSLAIADNIPLDLSYINDSYSKGIKPELSERVNMLVSEKELEKTSRMERTKLMN